MPDIADVFNAIAEHTGSTVEELVASLGATREAAEEALDIVELPEPYEPRSARPDGKPKKTLDHLPRRYAS